MAELRKKACVTAAVGRDRTPRVAEKHWPASDILKLVKRRLGYVEAIASHIAGRTVDVTIDNNSTRKCPAIRAIGENRLSILRAFIEDVNGGERDCDEAIFRAIPKRHQRMDELRPTLGQILARLRIRRSQFYWNA